MSTIGHNLPIRVTFQFLLAVRSVTQLSGRYSVSKLRSSLPQLGQEQSVRLAKSWSFERPLHFETCLMVDFGSSA
jgi:hypothetical protein